MCHAPLTRSLPSSRCMALLFHCTCASYRKSFWKPYLDVLPATFSTPLYYTLKELELLRGSAALDEVC